MYGSNRGGNGLRELIDFAAIGSLAYVILRHVRIKKGHHLLLLAAVIVMIIGTVLGFALGGDHTNNCGMTVPPVLRGIQHEDSVTACTALLLGTWAGGLGVLAGIVLALTCLTWVHTGTGPAWVHADLGRGPAPSTARRMAIPEALRAAVVLRDHGRCVVCGQRGVPGNALVFDHYYPVALGGATVLGNVRLLHQHANEVKGARWPWTDDPRYCLAA